MLWPNVYESHRLDVSSMAIEHQLTEIVKDLRQSLKIPIAVKLSPFFAAFGNLARRLDAAGANGLVIFNRFYQPDIDIKTMRASPHVELSTSAELLLRLRWLAILHGHVRASLAVTGGIATPNDGIKALLAGADAVQIVSAFLRHGPAYVSAMRRGLDQWMDWQKLSSLEEVRGRVSLKQSADPAAFERANYIRALQAGAIMGANANQACDCCSSATRPLAPAATSITAPTRSPRFSSLQSDEYCSCRTHASIARGTSRRRAAGSSRWASNSIRFTTRPKGRREPF